MRIVAYWMAPMFLNVNIGFGSTLAVLSTPKVTHSGTSLTSSHINSATTRTVQPEIPCFDNEATACSKDYTSSKNTRPVRDVTGTGTAGTGVSDNDGTATDATVTITAAIDVIAAAVTAPDATVTNTKVMDVTITDATVTNTAATDIPGTDATDTNSTTIDVTGTDVTVTDATVTNTTAIDVTGTTASPDVVVTDDREATTDDDTASDDAPSDGVMAGTSTVRSETTSTSNFCSGTTGLTTLQSMERPTPMCSTVLKKETVEEDQGSAPISLQRKSYVVAVLLNCACTNRVSMILLIRATSTPYLPSHVQGIPHGTRRPH